MLNNKEYSSIPILDSLNKVIPMSKIADIEEFEEELNDLSPYIALRMQGDDMVPTINDSDTIIVRESYCVHYGAIALVLVDDTDVYCRRIYEEDNGIDLVADNPAYKTKHFYMHERERIRIIGKVIEVRKSFYPPIRGANNNSDTLSLGSVNIS